MNDWFTKFRKFKSFERAIHESPLNHTTKSHFTEIVILPFLQVLPLLPFPQIP